MASNNLLLGGTATLPSEKQFKQTLKNTKYLHPSAAAKQILPALDDFTYLKPSVKEYVYRDGKRADLMQLSGVVPVKVIGTDQQYKVPVRLWLPKSFPREGPLIQVHPTSNMALLAVNYMDTDGMVVVPYLKHWKEGRSDLSTLIEMIKYRFCQTCPVQQIRVTSFSFGSSTPRNSTPSPSPKSTEGRHSMSDIIDNEVASNPTNGRDLEIFSYRKTIETLSKELDAFGSRVKELEQAKKESQIILEQARSMNQTMLEQASISNGSIEQQEEMLARGLEVERAERVKHQEREEILARELQRETEERLKCQQQEELLLRELEIERAEREKYQEQEEMFVKEVELERAERERHQQQAEMLVMELDEERREKEKYIELLVEEKAQVEKEAQEKERVQSRLDSKISDLTQTRERIAIVEVEKDEYLQKLQRTVKELKFAKMEVREQVSLKRALKARVSAMELQLKDQRDSSASPLGQLGVSAEVSAVQQRARSSELSEVQQRAARSSDQEQEFQDLETEKQELLYQLQQSQQAKLEVIEERNEMKKKLDTALQLHATRANHVSQDSGVTTPPSVSLSHASTHSDRFVQAGVATKPAAKSVQVDTLTDLCTQYRLQSEKSSRELFNFMEETKKNNQVFHAKVRDTGAKILQLLDIKEKLTKKNEVLQKRIEELELEAPEQEVSLNGALRDLHGLQHSLSGGDEGQATGEQLQSALAEIEAMKQSHLNEKLAMTQRLSSAISKVKEREGQQAEEISELRMKLEKTQKRLQEVSNTAVTNTVGGANIPESLVSFMELEDVAPYKLDEGTWGAVVEAEFRGSRVAVRCVTKESLALYPIQTIHKQIHSLARTRHPQIALFIAAAMDAPSGIMILTELLTCSLRQAYQSSLIKPDKLPILLDIALALNFLHMEKKPVVHNNLSSHCVLVEEGAEGQWRAKLSDIGVTTSLMMLSGLGERESVYRPPELEGDTSSLHLVEANGHSLGSPSLDVYSYGVLMCELASSNLPSTPADVVRQLSELRDSRLPQIAFLVQNCTAANPIQRPTTGNLVKKLNHLIVNKIQVP